MADRRTFVSFMLQVSPPWLTRAVGGAIMAAFGDETETELARDVEGVELRFPGNGTTLVADPDALALVGRERRILRGPGESDSTFATRLLRWWEAHRIRGSAYALLVQMHEYFLSSNNVPIQYIDNAQGTSVTVDAAGVLTRSTVAGWNGDGEAPPNWARFFLVFYFDSDTLSVPLLTESGDPVLTEGGEPVLVTSSLFSLSASDIETLCAVPREWSAAHIDRIYIALIPAGGYAWGLPPGIAWGDVGKTWGGGLTPPVITC